MANVIVQNPPYVEEENKGWYVDVTLQYAELPKGEDFAFEIMESLEDYHPGVAIHSVKRQIFLSLYVDKESYLAALTSVNEVLAKNPLTTSAWVVSAEVKTEEQLDEELEKSDIPELVSYSEIGEICNVTRQRARVLADKEGFPEPLVVTSQGPLFGKHAVQVWERNRSTKPGRPRKR
ncbi:hypothetical protein [Pasteurella multocida]|uniref:hypothetical protein n=1 Tax=Pasteurella multocida TaxID=747 RepID=UPI0006595F27|nr:hypothetical protein [Pasteurella multocida]KLT46589.1 hypothetical protein PVACC_11385 [Pasteurella multocida subsp. multocida]